MKHYLLAATAALSIAATTTVKAQDVDPFDPTPDLSVSHKLVGVYSLGSSLEDGTSEVQITKKEINFYDLNNNLLYTGKYGVGQDGNFTLTNLTKYTTEERNDSIIQTTSEKQWGLYNYGDMGFKDVKPTGTLSRIFNKKGQLLQEATSTYTYSYEYGEDGLATKMTKTITSSGKFSEAYEYKYSDGKLVAETAIDANGAFKFKNVYEYDEDGNKTVVLQYKRTDKSNEDTEYVYQREEWTYDDGILTQYDKYTNGKATAEPTASSRKTYEPVNGNSYKTLITSYSYSKYTEEWSKSGKPTIEEYADFYNDVNTTSQLYGTELTVNHIPDTYSVNVSFMCPMIASVLPSQLNVYRDGHLLKTLTVSETNLPEGFDPDSGIINVVDSAVLVGHHDYFVQTLVGQDTENDVWMAANISPVASVDINFNINPVSKLKFAGAKQETAEDGDGAQNVQRTLTVSYQNPAYDETAGFISNELCRNITMGGVTSYESMDATKDQAQTTMSGAFPNNADKVEVYIVSHYKYGTVKSDILTITRDEFDHFNDAKPVRKLVGTYTLGQMLEGAADMSATVTKKEISYYDLNNRLAFVAKYAIDTYNDFTLNKITTYTTEERNDSIIQTANDKQWGLFNFGDPGFKKVNVTGSLLRIYNKAGQLLKDVQASYTYDYEYNEAGLLTKTTKSYTSKGNVSEITKHVYDSNNVLLADTVTDANGKFKYANVYEYDEQGNKTKVDQWKRKTADNKNSEYVYQTETWEYEDGKLAEYTKYTGGKAPAAEGEEATEPTASTRKTYEPYNGNDFMSLIKTYTYNKYDETWNQSATSTVEEYAEFNEDTTTNAKLYGTELNITRIENSYNVNVAFACPAIATDHKVQFNLYRDGHFVQTVSTDSLEYDATTNMFNIVDSTALAGHHDYFVQPVVATDDNATSWMAANIAPVASDDIDFNIAPVTDLKLSAAKKETAEDGDGDKNVQRTATISYTNPVYKEGAGFKMNELYRIVSLGGITSYENWDGTTDMTQTEMSGPFPNSAESIEVIIVSHYKYGTVVSEPLTITKEEFEVATGISTFAPEAGMKLNLTGDAVSINGKANIRIIAADGRQMASAKNASSLSLANIHGTFMVCVEKNGKIVKAIKATRK